MCEFQVDPKKAEKAEKAKAKGNEAFQAGALCVLRVCMLQQRTRPTPSHPSILLSTLS